VIECERPQPRKLVAHAAHLGMNFGGSASNALTKFLEEPEFVTQMLAVLSRYDSQSEWASRARRSLKFCECSSI
jgi:hypothetical protein